MKNLILLLLLSSIYAQASIHSFVGSGSWGEDFNYSSTNNLSLMLQETNELIKKYKIEEEETFQQQPLNAVRCSLMRLFNNKLYCIYHIHRKQLSPNEMIQLDADMSVWIKITNFYQDKAYNRWRGGSLASSSGALESIRRTDAMIKILEKRMK